MSQWSMSNVPGWKGLKPSSTNSLLLARPLDSKNVQNPPGFDSKMLGQNQVDAAIAAQTDNRSADAEHREQVMNRIAWNTHWDRWWNHEIPRNPGSLEFAYTLPCPWKCPK